MRGWIQRHYRTAYGRATKYLPYGTDLEPVSDDGTLARLGLEAGRYVLYVSRLEPENNARVAVEAYGQVRTDLPLAVVGDAPYASDYVAALKATTDRRVRFLGAIYGTGYRVLRSHVALYIQATEVGGTHPALLEAMGYGNAIVANDGPEHREALGDAGRYYHGPIQLAAAIQELPDDPEATARQRSAAHARAAAQYSWDAVTDAYWSWFRSLVQPGPLRLAP